MTSPSASRPLRLVRAFVAACAAALPLLASAQAISIQTPQLPARGEAGPGATQAAYGQQPGPQAGAQPAQGTQPGRAPSPQPAAGPQPAHGQQPGSAAQPSAWGQQQQPAWGQPQQPGWGQQPAPQSGWGQGQPGAGQAAAQAPQAPASPLQQQRRAGGAHGQYAGDANAGGPGQVAMVAPTPSAPGGTCRVQPSPDRQSMSLLGPDGQPRRHLPLGDFRVQQVVHSPDGMWAVAYTKLRGEPQFAAMTLDLTRCETTNTVDLPAAGEAVRFEADSAIVQMTQGERRLRLASTRVR